MYNLTFIKYFISVAVVDAMAATVKRIVVLQVTSFRFTKNADKFFRKKQEFS